MDHTFEGFHVEIMYPKILVEMLEVLDGMVPTHTSWA